ncbi:hypothetical protein OTU49_009317, partial [Cherax quadricarinatus]
MTRIQSDTLLNLLEKLNISESQVSEDELSSTITYIIKACRVPPLQNKDVPYTASDFEGVANNAEIQLNVILKIIEKICFAKRHEQHFTPLFIRNVVVNCLLVACEFIDENWEWCNKITAAASANVITKLCDVCNCKSAQQLLNCSPTETVDKSSHNNGTPVAEKENALYYIKFILQKFSELFNKNNWKLYPSLKMSYWWILQHLNQRTLGEHLSYLLPPALFILDDWEQQNKILGIRCLFYILKTM